MREQLNNSVRPAEEDDSSNSSAAGAQGSGSEQDAAGEATGGTGVVWTTSEEEEGDEGDADSSDGGEEEDGVGREQLGRMAESMLAALGSLDGLRQGRGSGARPNAAADGTAAASRQGRGVAAAHLAAGPGRQDADEEADLAEVRWEPALQLPPPVDSAEAAQAPAALAKAELLPGKQVRRSETCCCGQTARACAASCSLRRACAAAYSIQHVKSRRSCCPNSCFACIPVSANTAHARMQLTAPPRDARRQAREARKAAPDTAGRSWFDLPAPQITDEVGLVSAPPSAPRPCAPARALREGLGGASGCYDVPYLRILGCMCR